VLGFEHDVLGLDVVVPPEPGEPAALANKPPTSTPAPTPTPEGQAGSRPPAPSPSPSPSPAPTPAPMPAPAPADTSLPVAVPEPLDDEDSSRALASLRTVDVKVLVDPELVARDPEWIASTTRLLAASSRSFQNLFGIELRVVGVVRWELATAALSRDQMLEDLRQRPTEGADLVVALTARGVGEDHTAPTVAEDEHNASRVIVFADARARAPHLRPLLRELGHAFGAPDVTDTQSDAYQRGSWMSAAPVPEGSAPWIDAHSRRVILERKHHPFEETP
jgi:hypothetical protein